jgi:tRNA (adenine22-N1)-methyltransferase
MLIMRRYKQLDKRLTAVAELVREGATVCDVGTDHAHLPCYLARSGKYGQVYACELNPKPLEVARAQIEYQQASLAFADSPPVLIQSDGLENVPPVDDVIIAGMGGELIAEIAERIPPAFKTPELRLILQPMTRAEHLRVGLRRSGYEIISEQTVFENNRNFIIIYAKLGGQA